MWEWFAFLISTASVGVLTYGMVVVIQRHARQPVAKASDLRAIRETLEHLEQAVDSIAIEVERVEEGQRFVTRLLGDREASALRSGNERSA